MQADQVKGMLDRAAAVLATMFLSWLVKHGYIGESDSAQLLPAIVLLPSLAWGWWRNRNIVILQSAARVVGPDGRKTVVVASPELANNTPEMNIVPSNAPRETIVTPVEEARR